MRAPLISDRDGQNGGQYRGHYVSPFVILSAGFKAKADTKNGSDGFSWDMGGKSSLPLLQMSQFTRLLPDAEQAITFTIVGLRKIESH